MQCSWWAVIVTPVLHVSRSDPKNMVCESTKWMIHTLFHTVIGYQTVEAMHCIPSILHKYMPDFVVCGNGQLFCQKWCKLHHAQSALSWCHLCMVSLIITIIMWMQVDALCIFHYIHTKLQSHLHAVDFIVHVVAVNFSTENNANYTSPLQRDHLHHHCRGCNKHIHYMYITCCNATECSTTTVLYKQFCISLLCCYRWTHKCRTNIRAGNGCLCCAANKYPKIVFGDQNLIAIQVVAGFRLQCPGSLVSYHYLWLDAQCCRCWLWMQKKKKLFNWLTIRAWMCMCHLMNMPELKPNERDHQIKKNLKRRKRRKLRYKYVN